jgi:hypothetical protein
LGGESDASFHNKKSCPEAGGGDELSGEGGRKREGEGEGRLDTFQNTPHEIEGIFKRAFVGGEGEEEGKEERKWLKTGGSFHF